MTHKETTDRLKVIVDFACRLAPASGEKREGFRSADDEFDPLLILARDAALLAAFDSIARAVRIFAGSPRIAPLAKETPSRRCAGPEDNPPSSDHPAHKAD